jgi:hypothetical protein
LLFLVNPSRDVVDAAVHITASECAGLRIDHTATGAGGHDLRLEIPALTALAIRVH